MAKQQSWFVKYRGQNIAVVEASTEKGAWRKVKQRFSVPDEGWTAMKVETDRLVPNPAAERFAKMTSYNKRLGKGQV